MVEVVVVTPAATFNCDLPEVPRMGERLEVPGTGVYAVRDVLWLTNQNRATIQVANIGASGG